tara:strand:- start:222 stop:1037 length:816 start_codon:yes stop_codon:yes gene_type:complete
MADSLKIGVVGASGRMGRMLINIISNTSGCEIAGATEAPDSESLGEDSGILAGVGENNIPIIDNPKEMFADVDVVIDFTAPKATISHVEIATEIGCPIVIGTTGMDDVNISLLKEASKSIPIIRAPNMSAGVNLMFSLARQIAKTLDEEFDIEIFEAHHRHKVDAPSGTALGLGEAAAQGRGVDFDKVKVLSREGITGERESGKIGFSTMRAGDIIGTHTVVFASQGEQIEITHKATDRAIFARGAVRAAIWISTQSSGLYSMADVLGLSE